MQEAHFKLSDTDFEAQFKDTSLPPKWFTHQGHLRLAWIHLEKYGLEQACQNVCNQILQFDIIHGKGDAFHKTVSFAAVQIIHQLRQSTQVVDFAAFLSAYPSLQADLKALLHQHYSPETLWSEQAKWNYITPDRKPF